ncbi:restriction endonuclease subunit S (plasmid) [Lactococcus cremoris]|uniref:Restriction endonuclease subunit S n=2 Tax=Lactococcus lactis subsp. cremoris TaxID=1359 RepID=A0AAJ6N3S7_LACLC|nr:restriction endonuclease subunit S [Lactococcus cremoris]EQC85199.1 hypothetical protein LLT7_03000 [Lactococcus cremoris subsp. cremoris TIFN7]WOW94967.1 restriction endonuclease subunit S [Lactococcus cremoris]
MAKIDDSVKKKVPELRFPGFTYDWEERKLIEVADYRNGKAHEKDISEDGYYIVVNSKFVSTNGLVKKYSDEMIAPLSKNEIAFVLSDVPNGRAIARTFLINEDNKYSLNQRIAGITPHADTNSYFLHSLMNRNHYFLRFDDGVSQTNLSKREVEKWVEFYPSYQEQQKIGSFFKQLDDTIALHQRKLDLLKEQKKGYLQKMFPKNGAKVPELRFAGFADDWEERKLGDEVRIVMGQSPNSENYTDDPNDYILVQGNADMKNGRVFPRVWTTQVTKQAEKDDLILSVRAPVGDIGKTAYDVVIGRGVAAIKGNEFIFQNLGKMKSDGYWTRYSTGSTFESINSTDIKEAIISVPAIEEQRKIGSFFKQLDDTITLHQRKLDLLKEQKKGFLQKMFV